MQLNIRSIFFTLTGFQITWLCCVFGEYYNFNFLGLIVGILYLTIFFYFNNSLNVLKMCFIFSIIGYLFDSFLGITGLLVFKSEIIIGYLPIWFLVLWPSFVTLFVNILNFLKNRPIFAFLVGSIFGPTTYYLGIPLNLAHSENLLFAMLIMFLFWGIFLTFYSIYIKNNF